MKIVMINGSPRVDSNSGRYLKDLQGLLDVGEVQTFENRACQLCDGLEQALADCQALVLACPLYADGLPSHFLKALTRLEAALRGRQELRVYGMVNCGFYEASQTRLALEIMRNWCARAGVTWGAGLGIGSGEMLGHMEKTPLGKGPKKDLGKAMLSLARLIMAGQSGYDMAVTANFPRMGELLMGNWGWNIQAKENGLTKADLRRQVSWGE